jgi:hypothetical protein
MIDRDPRLVFVIGFLLVLLGAVIPWLMVLHVLKSTFVLNFFAAGASTAGLILGVIGTAFYVRLHKR